MSRRLARRGLTAGFRGQSDSVATSEVFSRKEKKRPPSTSPPSSLLSSLPCWVLFKHGDPSSKTIQPSPLPSPTATRKSLRFPSDVLHYKERMSKGYYLRRRGGVEGGIEEGGREKDRDNVNVRYPCQ